MGRRDPIVEGDIARIPLTKGLYAVVDLVDLPTVAPFLWIASGSRGGYIYALRRRRGSRKSGVLLMHRAITEAGAGVEVDHINHDTLDNRRSNLRLVSKAENQWNRKVNASNISGVKGVSWCRRDKRWIASIQANGMQVQRGFKTMEEAVNARKLMESEMHQVNLW